MESYLGVMATWLTNKNLELAANFNIKPQHYDDRNSRGNGIYRKETGFYSALSISEVFEDYIHEEKIKNVANRLLFLFAIIMPILTLLLLFKLSL